MADVGKDHNRQPDNGTEAQRERLRSFVDRVVSLQDEKKVISDAIGDVYKEAKAEGWDSSGIKSVVRRLRMDQMAGDAETWFRSNYWEFYNGRPMDDAPAVVVQSDPVRETTEALTQYVADPVDAPEPDPEPVPAPVKFTPIPEEDQPPPIPESMLRPENRKAAPDRHPSPDMSDAAATRKDAEVGAAPKPKPAKAKPSPKATTPEAPDF